MSLKTTMRWSLYSTDEEEIEIDSVQYRVKKSIQTTLCTTEEDFSKVTPHNTEEDINEFEDHNEIIVPVQYR